MPCSHYFALRYFNWMTTILSKSTFPICCFSSCFFLFFFFWECLGQRCCLEKKIFALSDFLWNLSSEARTIRLLEANLLLEGHHLGFPGNPSEPKEDSTQLLPLLFLFHPPLAVVFGKGVAWFKPQPRQDQMMILNYTNFFWPHFCREKSALKKKSEVKHFMQYIQQ